MVDRGSEDAGTKTGVVNMSPTLGDREYFLQEWNQFYKWMGMQWFWSDLDRAANAYKGLLYTFLHTEETSHKEEVAMQTISTEYDRRLIFILSLLRIKLDKSGGNVL